MNNDKLRIAREISIVKELIDLRLLPDLSVPKPRHGKRLKRRPNTAIISEYAEIAIERRVNSHE